MEPRWGAGAGPAFGTTRTNGAGRSGETALWVVGSEGQTLGQVLSVVPPSRMVGSQWHPAPQCPLFDPRALPFPSGRKSRVACQEPGAPGNHASCKHGRHWPLSE